MGQGRALGCVAFTIVYVSVSVGDVIAAEKKPTNVIRILDATYGGNCAGVAKGNVTRFVASTCDGTDLCNYRVYYKNMGGDPAPDCEKAFRVTYICGKNSKPETCALEAEAGKGGENGQSNHFASCIVFQKDDSAQTVRVGRCDQGRTNVEALSNA